MILKIKSSDSGSEIKSRVCDNIEKEIKVKKQD